MKLKLGTKLDIEELKMLFIVEHIANFNFLG